VVTTATRKNKKQIKFAVKTVETIYEIDGDKFRRAIESAGLKQADIAEACGHKDATRVCHIARKGKQRISGEKLACMIACMREAGIVVEGFDDE